MERERTGAVMTCANARCLYWITCQKKERPCPANTARTVIVHNGYAAMATTEYKMRDSAINFKGDWDA
jgi:hypothetical protein